LGVFAERFEMVLEDLAGLPDTTAVLAEGWGLRPSLVAPHLAAPDQAIFSFTATCFDRSTGALGRAKRLSIGGLSDPARAQRNRVERDRLLADDVVASAAALGPSCHKALQPAETCLTSSTGGGGNCRACRPAPRIGARFRRRFQPH
jgi:hypothetical protein